MNQRDSVTRQIQARRKDLTELNGPLAVFSETISATILPALNIFDTPITITY